MENFDYGKEFLQSAFDIDTDPRVTFKYGADAMARFIDKREKKMFCKFGFRCRHLARGCPEGRLPCGITSSWMRIEDITRCPYPQLRMEVVEKTPEEILFSLIIGENTPEQKAMVFENFKNHIKQSGLKLVKDAGK